MIEKVCQAFAKIGDTVGSYTKGDQLCKLVNGEWVCKKMIKDPNHKGHRYIWEEDLAPKSN